jgi:carboxyl-terminal processing protease
VISAIALADLFLPPGTRAVFFKEASAQFPKDDKQFLTAEGEKIFFEKPVFMLVNEKTASAAELFADVMQRNKRGLVIGTQTLGKNKIQTVVQVAEGMFVALTTAVVEFESGGDRIFPDILLEKGDPLKKALELAESLRK